MSLIGIDIGSYQDMFELHEREKIEFFQVSARYLVNYLDQLKEGEHLQLPDNFRVVVHYSYSINLSHPWNPNDWWIQQLISEIKASHKIGAFGIVIHTGKSMHYSESAAINNMFSALLYVHNETIDESDLKLLIETPAGQGTELLSDIDNFTRFMNKFSSSPSLSERFGICVDTCHIYSAGINIANKKGISAFFDTIDKSVGISKVKLIHLNNSRAELGSKIDRHENLEIGTLSMQSIHTLVKFIDGLGIPMILETPAGDDYELIIKDYRILTQLVKQLK